MSVEFEYVEGYELNTNYREVKYFDFDPKTKEIEKVIEQPLISGEMNSQCIGFRIPRYYDGVDLSEKSIQVVYTGPTLYKDITPVINVERNDEYLKFIWVVPQGALLSAGDLMFSLEFTSEGYIMKSHTVIIYVEDALQGSYAVEEPEGKEWYQVLRENYLKLSDIVKNKLGYTVFMGGAPTIKAFIDNQICENGVLYQMLLKSDVLYPGSRQQPASLLQYGDTIRQFITAYDGIFYTTLSNDKWSDFQESEPQIRLSRLEEIIGTLDTEIDSVLNLQGGDD